jgi:hypothetical protein
MGLVALVRTPELTVRALMGVLFAAMAIFSLVQALVRWRRGQSSAVSSSG